MSKMRDLLREQYRMKRTILSFLRRCFFGTSQRSLYPTAHDVVRRCLRNSWPCRIGRPGHGDHGLCGHISCVRGKWRWFGRLDVPQASHKPFSVRRSAPSETASGEGFEQLVDVIHVIEHGWRHSQVIWAHPHMHFTLAQPLKNGLGVFPL